MGNQTEKVYESTVSGVQKRSYRVAASQVYPDTKFVGREQELEQIARMLEDQNKLFLVGMGGIGKSELVRQFLHKNRERFRMVIWLTFADSIEATIGDDHALRIEGLSKDLFPEMSQKEYFERKLELLKNMCDENTCIVLDNFDVEEDENLSSLLDGGYTMLVTTRVTQRDSHLRSMEVRKIERDEELLEIFQSEYQRALSKEEREKVLEITRFLRGHPLSIRLVGSTMRSRRIKPDQILELLTRGENRMQEQNRKAADMIYGRIHQVFRVSTLTEEEMDLLKNLSMISLNGIDVETFFEWCEYDDFDVLDRLIDRSWIIHNSVTDEVHLHPLIADIMHEELREDCSCVAALVDHFCGAATNTFNVTIEEKRKLFDYSGYANSIELSDAGIKLRLLYEFANMKADFFDHDGAAEICRQALQYEMELDQRLAFYHKLSHCLVLGGRYEEGIQAAREGISLLKDIPMSEWSKLAGYYRNELVRRLSEGSRYLGRFEDGVRYALEAVNTCEGFEFDSPEKNRGWADFHLGTSYFLNHQYAEAKEAFLHGIGLFEKINDQWSASYSYEFMGQIRAIEGHFDEAMSYNQKAYDILLPLYGEKSMPLVRVIMGRANIFRLMGDEENERKSFQEAKDIFAKYHYFNKADTVQKIMDGEEPVESIFFLWL